jgi:hypothetical protein
LHSYNAVGNPQIHTKETRKNRNYEKISILGGAVKREKREKEIEREEDKKN